MVQAVPTVGIIGYGFVGKATAELASVVEVRIYDPYIVEFSSPEQKALAYSSDVVICCVPTPEGATGHVDLSILEPCVDYWYNLRLENVFAIKSTIPAGTVDRLCALYNTKKIIHNPEFLTERTHIEDFRNPTDVVIGGDPSSCSALQNVYNIYYQSMNKQIDINTCSAIEAELVKTVRNSFYATKVIFMNEIHQFCERLNIDYRLYEKILTNSGKHPWWGPEHTKVPGPDGQFGFGGKCFPKDSSGLYQLAHDLGIELSVLKAAIDKNKKLRP